MPSCAPSHRHTVGGTCPVREEQAHMYPASRRELFSFPQPTPEREFRKASIPTPGFTALSYLNQQLPSTYSTLGPNWFAAHSFA